MKNSNTPPSGLSVLQPTALPRSPSLCLTEHYIGILNYYMKQRHSREDQLVKKFPTFYGTRRFITAFTSARHPSLSWARYWGKRSKTCSKFLIKTGLLIITFLLTRCMHIHYNDTTSLASQNYRGLFEMIVVVSTPGHLVLQKQPHVISFYGVTSRIRFMFLLFP